MADVYLAEDSALQRRVVIKTMLPNLAQDPSLVARFQREATATARLEHPNIVPVYTTGMTPDGRYLAFASNYLNASNEFDIWIINLETGELQRITERGDCYDPAWGAGTVR